MTRTRIVATLGPATSSEEAIGRLLDAGVDVFRLNFSHGTHAEHGARIAAIRRLAGARPVGILQDLSGPKFRLTAPVSGKPGDVVPLALPSTVRAGDPVLLADGLMQLEVVDPAHARVLVGGNIPAGKGINLPSSRLDVPALTDKDRADLAFGVASGVDFVALSFVRQAADLDEPRASGLPVIAKFEKAEALQHVAEIMRVADGIMVARGDLGVEIPIARVPMVQKELIAAANRAGKPVITATQMLRSMVSSPLPTRAEATDVANAVLDGTDAVMLSEETAVGDYPVESVLMLGQIAREAERALASRAAPADRDVAALMAEAACRLAAELDAAAIVVPSRTGFTARQVARHRPRVPIVALVPDERIRRQLSLVWGVTAITLPPEPGGDFVLAAFRAPLLQTGLVAAGSLIVLTAAWPPSEPAHTNLVHATRL